MAHRELHPHYVDGCFACKAMTIGISAAAMPTRKPNVVTVDQREERWQKDMPAYKRLRGNGLQPQGIDGCAELESRATDQFEVEQGNLFPTKEAKERAMEGFEQAAEMATATSR